MWNIEEWTCISLKECCSAPSETIMRSSGLILGCDPAHGLVRDRGHQIQ